MTNLKKYPSPTFTAFPTGDMPIMVQITLGNPLCDCRRFGICKMEALPNGIRLALPLPFKGVLALLFFGWACEITLMFLVKSMDAATREEHFGNGVFRVETPFHFESAKCLPSTLGNGSIQAGVYEVQTIPGFLVVRMRLAPKMDSS